MRFNLLRKCRGPQTDLSGADRYLGSEQTIVDVEVPGVVKVRGRGWLVRRARVGHEVLKNKPVTFGDDACIAFHEWVGDGRFMMPFGRFVHRECFLWMAVRLQTCNLMNACMWINETMALMTAGHAVVLCYGISRSK